MGSEREIVSFCRIEETDNNEGKSEKEKVDDKERDKRASVRESNRLVDG